MKYDDERHLNIERLLANLRGPYKKRDRALILLADAGLPPTQIAAREAQDVSFTGGDGLVGGATLEVHSKSNQSTVYLDQRAAQALFDLAERPSGRLFGKLRPHSSRRIPFLALRHAAATRLANRRK